MRLIVPCLFKIRAWFAFYFTCSMSIERSLFAFSFSVSSIYVLSFRLQYLLDATYIRTYICFSSCTLIDLLQEPHPIPFRETSRTCALPSDSDGVSDCDRNLPIVYQLSMFPTLEAPRPYSRGSRRRLFCVEGGLGFPACSEMSCPLDVINLSHMKDPQVQVRAE